MIGPQRRFKRLGRAAGLLRAIAPALLGILAVWLAARLACGMLSALAGC